MEKRLILAIALSSLVILVWSNLLPKSPAPEVVAPKPAIQAPSVTPVSAPKAEPPAESLVTFSHDKTEITFIEPQAAIKDVVFKAYPSSKFNLKFGLLWDEKDTLFNKHSESTGKITFVSKDENKQILKRFFYSKFNYVMELEIEIENLSTSQLNIHIPLTLGVLDFARDPKNSRFLDVSVALKDKTLHPNARKETSFNEVKFLGLRDRYFCIIAEPVSQGYSAYIKKINHQQSEIGFISRQLSLLPGQKQMEKFYIYLGPQDLRLISSADNEWSSVIYFGTFDVISHLLLQVLDFIYSIVKNWGVTIVILSVLIYILLFPLTLKQLRSAKEMQALQPQIAQLKKMYKDNPQRQNKEIMELLRQHKVNPLAGCLPLILQIPIFFALYQTLIRSVALKGASFLWIKDLSEPDRLFVFTVSDKSIEINILPILMTIGMFIQQKMSMRVSAGGSAEQQKLMTILFPLLFGFIFYQMPSGLVLYWFINSSLMLAYQLRLNKLK